VIFRRLASESEVAAELGDTAAAPDSPLAAFARIRTRAMGFVVFDRLLVTVHPAGCFTARLFLDRYLADVMQADGFGGTARNRLPLHPGDLMLRMLNLMVDSYLDLRKILNSELDAWQQQLLAPNARVVDWGALLTARNALHALEDLCEEQKDAMQEWLDSQREQSVAVAHPGRERRTAGPGARRGRAHRTRGAPRAAHGARRGDRCADPFLGAGPPHQ